MRLDGAAERAGDLGTRSDVHDLVVSFYREVVFDDMLEPVFGEVAEVDWASHIPKLIDYWCRALFGDPSYRGAVLAPHRHVHEIEPLRVEHFDRWYRLWAMTIDDRWAGPTAEQAKRHAARIGGSLARQLLRIDWHPDGSAEDRGAGRSAAAVSARPDPRLNRW
jgi:hemoglobin